MCHHVAKEGDGRATRQGVLQGGGASHGYSEFTLRQLEEHYSDLFGVDKKQVGSSEAALGPLSVMQKQMDEGHMSWMTSESI